MFNLKSDCYISGFKVIGGKSGFWSDLNICCTIKNCIVENSIESAIYLYDGDGYTLDNIIVINPGQCGNLSYSNGIYSRVDNSTIKNCTITSDKVKHMKWGIDIEAGNTVNVLSNKVSGSWQASIRVAAGAKPIMIKENDIDDTTEGYDSECAISLAGHNDDSEVLGNHIDNVVASSAIGVYDAWGIKIKDNFIGIDDNANDIKREGIRVSGCGGSGSNRLEVTGNKIQQTRYAAIILMNSSNSYVDNNTISKCNYYGADGTGDWDYAAIHGENDSTDLIITNNKISDSINGIQVWGNNCIIKSNEVYDMGLTYADTKVTADGTYYNSGIIVGTNWLSNNFKPTGTVVKKNSLYDNIYGIFVRDYATLSPLDPAPLNLSSLNCWFGDTTGPDDDAGIINGYGNKIAKTVTAEPFENKGNRATDVRNDSTVTGASVKDALETIDGQVSTVTKTLYVDGNRTDSYTENGSIIKPFKLIQSAINQVITNGDNSASLPYLIKIVSPGNYDDITLNSNKLTHLSIEGDIDGGGIGVKVANVNITGYDECQVLYLKGLNITNFSAIGANDNSLAYGSDLELRDCWVTGSIVAKNVKCFGTYNGRYPITSIEIENVAWNWMMYGNGIDPSTFNITYDGTKPKPSGCSSIYSLFIDCKIATSNLVLTGAQTIQLRQGTRFLNSSQNITLVANQTLLNIGSSIRGTIINNGGTFDNYGFYLNINHNSGIFNNHVEARHINNDSSVTGDTVKDALNNLTEKNGVSGSFTTTDGKTITIVEGQVTSIV